MCAEKNRGIIVGSVGKSTVIDSWCLSATGTYAGYFSASAEFSPLIFIDGKIDSERFRKNCPRAHSMVLAEPQEVPTCPDFIPGALELALALPLELSWETFQILRSLWISFWPCFSASYQLCTSFEERALKTNPVWSISLLLSIRFPSQGFWWGIAERDVLQVIDGHQVLVLGLDEQTQGSREVIRANSAFRSRLVLNFPEQFWSDPLKALWNGSLVQRKWLKYCA